MAKQTLLREATIEDFTDAMVRGNGFAQESIWSKEHFGNKPFTTVEENLDPYSHNIAQFVMAKFFEKELGYKKTLETYYDEGGQSSIVFENLEFEPKKFMQVYKKAFIVYEKNKHNICVSINKYGQREITYRVYTSCDQQDTMQKWLAYARKNNLYKGKKIAADCSFLELSQVSWDDVILDDETIRILNEQVTEMFTYSEYLKANKISMKRGVILAGPPGTGKTMLCKVLAKGMDGTVIYAMPSQMERTIDVRRICDMTKDLAPAMLIIEDIDYIAENREEAKNAGLVIELMNYMDGIQEFNDIVTLATTNAQDKIEEAVKNRPGRFDRVVQIPKPLAALRKRMITAFTKNFDTTGLDIGKLVKLTKDYSGAHIKHICESAAFKAIRSKSTTADKIAIVKNEHFDEAFKDLDNEAFSSFHKAKGVVRKISFDPYDD